MMVKEELKKLGVKYVVIDLGTVEILENIIKQQHHLLKVNFLKSGLKILEDKRGILIEKIKNVFTAMIHYSDEMHNVNYF